MLRDIARDVFTVDLEDSMPHAETTEELEHGAPDSDEVQRVIIPDDEDDGMMLLTSESLNKAPEIENCNDDAREKRYSNLFSDVFYRQVGTRSEHPVHDTAQYPEVVLADHKFALVGCFGRHLLSQSRADREQG
ncbi:hypothetical protein B0H13DRAFT_2313446 [Mycena leptocephala]|nr:hypothetical protein B0H13DRAFT_2313446 [Mycena leptocephala]